MVLGTFITMENQSSYQLTTEDERYFEILPDDWKALIEPFWNQYKSSAAIYVFKNAQDIIAGGIVFKTCPPDLLAYQNALQHWFDAGYYYLGFIFVKETLRGQNLGSKWLNELKRQYPNQKFWLLIEDEKLHHFYIKNGFQRVQDFQNGDQTEGLYVYNDVLNDGMF